MKKQLAHLIIGFTYKYAMLIIGLVCLASFSALIYYMWDMWQNYFINPAEKGTMTTLGKVAVSGAAGGYITVKVKRAIKITKNKIAGL